MKGFIFIILAILITGIFWNYIGYKRGYSAALSEIVDGYKETTGTPLVKTKGGENIIEEGNEYLDGLFIEGNKYYGKQIVRDENTGKLTIDTKEE